MSVGRSAVRSCGKQRIFTMPGECSQCRTWLLLLFSERERVHVRYVLSPVHLSSVICNVRAPYTGGSNLRQYFYSIRYLGHPLTSTENFMEIVTGEPIRRGS